MPKALPITTDRLILRDFVPDDLDALSHYLTDPEVNQWLLSRPASRKEVKPKLESWIEQQNAKPRSIYSLAMVLKDTNELIGNCRVEVKDVEHRVGEVGYVIAKQVWRRGFATEAVKAILEYGFHELKLHRIWGSTPAVYEASQNVMLKAGMKYEGCLRDEKLIRGQFYDVFLYARLETD